MTGMLDYDREADHYDVTRGGDARAASAAAAVRALLPPDTTRLADLACGTGIVTVRLTRPGRQVIGIDLSSGMTRIAATRLPGRITIGDVTRLPLADASMDAVVMIWLLHLMNAPAGAAALTEVARVLRPGGTLLTTVDKNDAVFATDDDTTALIKPVRAAYAAPQTDATGRVTDLGAPLGLTVTGENAFPGTGQGRSPRRWREHLLAGAFTWAKAAGDDLTALCERLQALPDQDRPRPDPVYRLLRLTKV
ncbi:class I SAM-dependent methyltransferase [Actinoallomurus oryzae]|uniref:Class I SAM-dependent methyltransferase n=1 Tax=Actinoallomurus oryzae TaxID=502180 RepID=A0ABP8P8A3_9ACTN